MRKRGGQSVLSRRRRVLKVWEYPRQRLLDDIRSDRRFRVFRARNSRHEESQTPEGEALRDDDFFNFVSAWEYKGEPGDAVLHKEDLAYENIEVKERSYK